MRYDIGRVSINRLVTVIVCIVIASMMLVGISRCVAAKDERITSNLDRWKRCTEAGHFVRKERQATRQGAFTYWCTNEDGFLYDLWFDSGRDYRSGPEFR